MEKELTTIGISNENIKNAKEILTAAMKKQRILVIELEQKELEINKLLIDDPEKNWFRINQLFERRLNNRRLMLRVDIML